MNIFFKTKYNLNSNKYVSKMPNWWYTYVYVDIVILVLIVHTTYATMEFDNLF